MRKKRAKPYSIEELKENFNLEHSDDLFGIKPEIPLQCPRINVFIEDVDSVSTHLDKLKNLLEDNENIELNRRLIRRELYVLERYVNESRDSFEELRTAFENLRSWGQGWKHLARNLFVKVPNNKFFLEEKYKKQV